MRLTTIDRWLKKMLVVSYRHVDDLEDGAGDVTAPVGVAEEGADEREDVDGAGPLADVVGRLGVVLVEHPPQEHHQVHTDAEEGARHEPVVSCSRCDLQSISIINSIPSFLTESSRFMWLVCSSPQVFFFLKFRATNLCDN